MEIRWENLTIDDYTKMINTDPSNYNLYVDRGILCDSNGDINAAKKDYTEAIQLNPFSFEAYNNRGTIYRRERVYDLAITDFTMCVEINPLAVQGYINRGSTYDDMHDYRTAIEDFSRAIAINSTDYEVYLFRWKAYNALGEEKLAIADLEKAFEIDRFTTEQWIQRCMNPPLNSDSAGAHIQGGLELLGNKEYDLAIAEFTEAIKIGSQSDAIAYNNRGMAHAAKKEYALAIEDYKKAIELNCEYAKAYSNLGIVYFMTTEYSAAIENLTQTITRLFKIYNLDPDNKKTFLNTLFYRGISYTKTRNFDFAKKDFETILEINPNDNEVKQLLAENFINQGLYSNIKLKNKDKAIDAFNEAIKIDSKLSPAFVNRGNCFFSKGLYDEAIADYDTALLLRPQDINAYKIREWALYEKKWAENHPEHFEVLAFVDRAFEALWDHNYDLAFNNFEQALQICSDNAFIFYQRGLTYAQIGESVKSIKDFIEAIKLAPLVAAVYYDRGNQYSERQIYDKAVEDFTMAIQIYPQFSDAYCNRGTCFFLQGKYESAIENFEEALRINPDDEEVKINLQKVIHLKRNYN
jgi:tetratricopeptide (TPR) repeat protein